MDTITPKPATVYVDPNYNPPQKENHKFKNVLIIVGLILPLVAGLFIVGKYLFFTESKLPKAPPRQTWQEGKQLIQKGQIVPLSQILQITLSYNKKNSPPIEFKDVVIKNGYPPAYPKIDKGYRLQVLDSQRREIGQLVFKIPDKPEGVALLPGETKPPPEEQILLTSIDFTLTIAYSPKASELNISDPDGVKITSKPLVNIPTIDNQPDFFLKTTPQIPKKQSWLDGLIKNTFAQSPPPGERKFYIAFIGYGYSRDNDFRKDADRFANQLFQYEPFRSRSSQIGFSYAPINTAGSGNVDLDCQRRKGTPSRRISCSQPRVISAINGNGLPYHKIMVIYNDEAYGGSAEQIDGIYGVAYIGEWGPHTFVHELGHLMGLIDEYIVVQPNDLLIDRNCIAASTIDTRGTPWEGITTRIAGCNTVNLFKSSEYSIMYSVDVPYFNLVSQRIINNSFVALGFPFPSPIPSLAPSPTFSPLPSSSATPAPILIPTPSPTPAPTSSALPPQPSATPNAVTLPSPSTTTVPAGSSCPDECYSDELRIGVGRDSEGRCNSGYAVATILECHNNKQENQVSTCNGKKYQCIIASDGTPYWSPAQQNAVNKVAYAILQGNGQQITLSKDSEVSLSLPIDGSPATYLLTLYYSDGSKKPFSFNVKYQPAASQGKPDVTCAGKGGKCARSDGIARDGSSCSQYVSGEYSDCDSKTGVYPYCYTGCTAKQTSPEPALIIKTCSDKGGKCARSDGLARDQSNCTSYISGRYADCDDPASGMYPYCYTNCSAGQKIPKDSSQNDNSCAGKGGKCARSDGIARDGSSCSQYVSGEYSDCDSKTGVYPYCYTGCN